LADPVKQRSDPAGGVGSVGGVAPGVTAGFIEETISLLEPPPATEFG